MFLYYMSSKNIYFEVDKISQLNVCKVRESACKGYKSSRRDSESAFIVRVPVEALRLLQRSESVCRGP